MEEIGLAAEVGCPRERVGGHGRGGETVTRCSHVAKRLALLIRPSRKSVLFECYSPAARGYSLLIMVYDCVTHTLHTF